MLSHIHKGIVHPKITLLSSFTHPPFVPNLYKFLWIQIINLGWTVPITLSSQTLGQIIFRYLISIVTFTHAHSKHWCVDALCQVAHWCQTSLVVCLAYSSTKRWRERFSVYQSKFWSFFSHKKSYGFRRLRILHTHKQATFFLKMYQCDRIWIDLILRWATSLIIHTFWLVKNSTVLFNLAWMISWEN